MRIKILPEDKKFAEWIKDRDNWTCQKCGTKYDKNKKGVGRSIQCSHFWSRRHWATRFLPDNCDALCFGCHSLVEGDKQGWYRDFKIDQLGKKRYNELERLHNSIVKKQDAINNFKKWYKLNKND